eukprot:TRINITY_DN36800_c0_g1_i2.p1 TRINITY_DN36800_c0_g1~~TRINITY_DN36800_c0_g1_i2.p1  ORF type:complete len:1338 (+),score=274.53 TRINITY_DN36800_c0_g1_i2:111-4124(+)
MQESLCIEPRYDPSNLLVRELSQGRKMRSLEGLRLKLLEDQHRSLKHTESVQDGMDKVRMSTAPAGLFGLGATSAPQAGGYGMRENSFSQSLRDEVSAARLAFEEEVLAAIPSTPTSPSSPYSQGKELRPVPPSDQRKRPPAPRGEHGKLAADRGSKSEEGRVAAADIFQRNHSEDCKVAVEGSVARVLHLRLAEEPARYLPVHGKALDCAFCSADSEHLASLDADGNLNVWEVQQQTKVSMSAGSCCVMAACRSGDYLAAADETGMVVLMNAMGTTLSSCQTGASAKVLSMALSQTVLAVATSEKVLLLSVPQLQALEQLPHAGHISGLTLSTDGRLLAANDGDQQAVIWSISGDGSCQSLGRIKFTSAVNAMSFRPDSQQLAIGCQNKLVALYETSRFEHVHDLPCSDGVCCLAWCKDNRCLATGGHDKHVTLWDALDGKILFQLPRAEDAVRRLDWSPDGRLLAYICEGRSICLHALTDAPEVRQGEMPGEQVQTATSGPTPSPPAVEEGEASTGAFTKRAGAGMRSKGMDVLLLLDDCIGGRETGLKLHEAGRVQPGSEDVTRCAFMPDGTIALAGEEKKLVVWDVASNQQHIAMDLGQPSSALAISPCGNYAACACESQVEAWHTLFGERAGDITVEGEVLCLAFSREKLLAVGTNSNKVFIHLLPDLQEVQEVDLESHVQSFAFAPDSNVLAAGCGTDPFFGLLTQKTEGEQLTMKVMLWDLGPDGAGSEHLGSVFFTDVVHATAYSASGKLLAVGCENKRISLLLRDEKYETLSELICPAGVRSLAWGGRFLASAGEDCQVSVWDVHEEKVVFQLPKQQDWLTSISFNADCTLLAYCTMAGSSSAFYHRLEMYERTPEQVEQIHRKSFDRVDAGRKSIEVPKTALRTVGTVDNLEMSSNNQPLTLTFDEAEKHMTKKGSLDAPSKRGNGKLKSAGTIKDTSAILAVDSDDDSSLRMCAVISLSLVQPGASAVTDDGEDPEAKRLRLRALAAKDLGIELTAKQKIQVEGGHTPTPVQLGHGEEVLNCSFNSSGQYLAAGGEDQHLIVWDVASQKQKHQFSFGATVTGVTFSPSDRYIYCLDSENSITVFQLDPPEKLGTETLDVQPSAIAAISSPSEIVAVGTRGGEVRLFAARDLQDVITLQHGGEVHGLTFSSDSGMLAVGGGTDAMHGLMTHKKRGENGMKAVVWRPDSEDFAGNWSQMASLPWEDIIWSMEFSPSGLLAIGGEDRKISLVSPAKDFEQVSQLVCVSGVRCLSWAPSSQILASAGEDMQVTIWDVLDKSILRQLPKAPDWICSIAFSPDSKWFASCNFGTEHLNLWAIKVYEEDDQTV